MIKLDIVNHVADKTGVPKQKAEQVVDSLFNAMKEALAKGKRIELRGFGVFVVKPSDDLLQRLSMFGMAFGGLATAGVWLGTSGMAV